MMLKTSRSGIIMHILAILNLIFAFLFASTVMQQIANVLYAIFFEVAALHCRNFEGKEGSLEKWWKSYTGKS